MNTSPALTFSYICHAPGPTIGDILRYVYTMFLLQPILPSSESHEELRLTARHVNWCSPSFTYCISNLLISRKISPFLACSVFVFHAMTSPFRDVLTTYNMVNIYQSQKTSTSLCYVQHGMILNLNNSLRNVFIVDLWIWFNRTTVMSPHWPDIQVTTVLYT